MSDIIPANMYSICTMFNVSLQYIVDLHSKIYNPGLTDNFR